MEGEEYRSSSEEDEEGDPEDDDDDARVQAERRNEAAEAAGGEEPWMKAGSIFEILSAPRSPFLPPPGMSLHKASC